MNDRKPEQEHVERAIMTPEGRLPEATEARRIEKKVVRKLDAVILPLTVLLYIAASWVPAQSLVLL